MTFHQAMLAALLVGALGLFAWGRWRHDIVAMAVLLAAVLVGVVPAGTAFLGFGHPAVITVAAVFVLSHAIESTGVVGALARGLATKSESPALHIWVFCGLGATMSAFMNNVGALALLMPLVIGATMKSTGGARRVLMPLSFATMLGGMTTLIGTPPNIIVASFRQQSQGAGFALFDFLPVGGVLALCGLVYLALAGWRLIPRGGAPPERAFKGVEEYMAEFALGEEAPAIGRNLGEVVEEIEKREVAVLGMVRDRELIPTYAHWQHLRADDSLMVEGTPESLAKLEGVLGLTLAGKKGESEKRTEGAPAKARPGLADAMLAEVVVTPHSVLIGSTAEELRLRSRYHINLLAISRQGARRFGPLKAFRFAAGDVLLLQGPSTDLADAIAAFQALSLAERGLQVHQRRAGLIAVLAFAAALAAIALSLAPPAVALAAAGLAVVLARVIPPRQLYQRIDWSVIVLLGALLPVGEALQTTGLTGRIADLLLAATAGRPAILSLALVMILTMTLSDVINNAATAVVMAPIAAVIAQRLGVAADPFLMAVAIGASCAFLTPIGHQNNLLVMGPGGYRFGDYWRVGLPLEILIVALGVPLLAVMWPL